MDVTSDIARREILTGNPTILRLLKSSHPQFHTVPELYVLELFCRCIHHYWVTQLCILFLTKCFSKPKVFIIN